MDTMTAGQKAAATRRANALLRKDPITKTRTFDALVPMYSCQLVRDSETNPTERIASSAFEAAPILRAIIKDSDREHFVVMALDSRRRVIGANVVSIGTLNASLVHPREVFKPAILLNAAAIVVGHNHPSGDPAPSSEDREVTRRLTKAGELLGIPLADHVVIGSGDSFYSFREQGAL
jgi:DNA repair protein RadC